MNKRKRIKPIPPSGRLIKYSTSCDKAMINNPNKLKSVARWFDSICDNYSLEEIEDLSEDESNFRVFKITIKEN